jgi:hypothetical protein
VRSSFDRRVVPESVIDLIRACQRRADAHLAGGAALSGAHLGHRLSADVDLFCHEAGAVRALVRELPAIAAEQRAEITVVRDGGTHVRARVRLADRELELDLVHEPLADLEAPPPAIDDVVVESFADLRAAKLTCIVSRSEPRDLVDLLFLERAGFPPERDLGLAIRKGGGVDPGVIAWLLAEFPVRPLPVMLEPLSEAELRAYRDALCERFRAVAVPAE